VSPVRYELGVYIPDDGVLRIHRRESVTTSKTEMSALTGFTLRYVYGFLRAPYYRSLSLLYTDQNILYFKCGNRLAHAGTRWNTVQTRPRPQEAPMNTAVRPTAYQLQRSATEHSSICPFVYFSTIC
jgi:hypothetical protein